MLRIIILMLIMCSDFSLTSSAQVVEPKPNSPDWITPYRPFRMAGNLYYVGTRDLSSYLITTAKCHILINTGLSSSDSLIRANILSLGFRFKDIRILLTTQAHFDHMGAMASIRKATHAKFMVDREDSAVVADGGRSDYALGGQRSVYKPVRIDRILVDQDTITLGEMRLVMLHHPGHTKGSCSFLFDVKDDTKTYRVLIANMPTIVTDKKFTNIADYPTIAADYAYTLRAMKELKFDLWFASHTSQFGLQKKRQEGDGYNPEVFRDQVGYDAYLDELRLEFERKTNAQK